MQIETKMKIMRIMKLMFYYFKLIFFYMFFLKGKIIKTRKRKVKKLDPCNRKLYQSILIRTH